MKKRIDLDELTRLTHTPRGEYGATEENYIRLKNKLNEQPVVVETKPKHTLWQKCAIAASIIVVSSISYAMIKTFFIDMPQHKTLTYHEAPMKQILSDIEKEYKVRVHIEDTTKLDYKLTAEFSTEEDIEEIMASISAASGIELRLE